MNKLPETRYARSGDLHIAYQVMGGGPVDVVLVPGFVSHLDMQLQEPRSARFFERLSSFCRLIRFDKRGTGLSDRVGAMPTLEERMDDVRAVMDDAGSSRVALFGYSEGASMCLLFAATYPERVSALILYAGIARTAWAPDHPWGRTSEMFADRLKLVYEGWGRGDSVQMYAPSLVGDPEYVRWAAANERAGASPNAVVSILKMAHEIDVRHILPAISVPTLVMHRAGDRMVRVEQSRLLAERIPGAQYIEFPGDDHPPWIGDSERVLSSIESVVTGSQREPNLDRVLATILFTDIVGSTEHASRMGDNAWKELLAQHHFIVRQQLDRYRGKEIDTAGDGFLASFDGPARAVRCARAIVDSIKTLNIHIRSGVHTGECELMGNKLAGIAIHIGARIAALAEPDEVLVSSTVKDLVAGSGLTFTPRGTHALKGISETFVLHAAG